MRRQQITEFMDKARDYLDALIARIPHLSKLLIRREPPQADASPRPTRFRRLSDVGKQTPKGIAYHQRDDNSFSAPRLPIDAPVYAIGDIHGRADLLKALLEVVKTDCQNSTERPHLVFLGDYIDRGFQSYDVFETLIELGHDETYETVFLKGNHEQAMMRFLKDHSIGPDWAAFGGRETLISYNISPPKAIGVVEEWIPIQAQLVRTIPQEHVDFLEKLVLSHKIGPYGFVHAGVKPGVPYDQQSDEDRMWIRDEFLNAPDKEDLYIVHGHSPVNAPYWDHRRVNVDTGAYFTGRLTAVKILKDNMSFLTNKVPSQEKKK